MKPQRLSSVLLTRPAPKTAGYQLIEHGYHADRSWESTSIDDIIFTMLYEMHFQFDGASRLIEIRAEVERLIQEKMKQALKV